MTPTFCAVFQPTVIDMSNAGACGVSGWLGDIHGFISSVPSTRFIALGELEIDSAPPAMTTVSMPAMMLADAVCTAAMPDASDLCQGGFSRRHVSIRPVSIAA